MAITLDRETAKDLIESKLDGIIAEIKTILSTWNETDPVKSIEKTRTGELDGQSVRDAVAMRQTLTGQGYFDSFCKSTYFNLSDPFPSRLKFIKKR